ncbi:cation:dicarboxylase symporter family transporter [Streptomyces sp. 150FB]|uniref:cation:dicarboxylate symporter family transporter n=1 Tax=Streptomyces sp. 150FB TaxID=1576605 RepID=UPI0007C75116|nr:cation:dicarboxylase symporter family transporter [Streptomyces sp. 150FB]
MSLPTTIDTPGRRPERSGRAGRLLKELWFQVVVGAVLGVAVGLLAPGVGLELGPLSDWFISLVKMIVVPVVFCVVTTGIASMDNVRRAGRIGVKALAYFVVLSLLSMLIGLVAADIFRPGSGLHVDVSTLDASSVPGVQGARHNGFTDFVSSLIPDTLFSVFFTDNILAALFVSLLMGFALNVAGERAAPLTRGISALSDVVFRIVSWVMRLAPFGTFGALAVVVSTYGATSLRQLGFLILLFTAVCVLYIVIVLGGVMAACRLSLLGLVRYLKEELLIALSTCSSEAVLPQLVRKLEVLGAGRSIVGITIPAGFSFNLDGSAIYLTMSSMFLAQAVGIDLSWPQQLAMVGVMMLTSKGTAGVTGGAFIVLASSLSAIGHIPIAALALIVGVDRILNEGRVFINVLGNAVATVVIGKWENDFDSERAVNILSNKSIKPNEPNKSSELNTPDEADTTVNT